MPDSFCFLPCLSSRDVLQWALAQRAPARAVDSAAWLEAAHEARQQLVRHGAAPLSTGADAGAGARACYASGAKEPIRAVSGHVQPADNTHGSASSRRPQEINLGNRRQQAYAAPEGRAVAEGTKAGALGAACGMGAAVEACILCGLVV